MITLKEAINIAKNGLSSRLKLHDSYGEAQGQYVFTVRRADDGEDIPGGFHLTVDKETGERSWTYPLKRDSLKPYAKIVGYKKLELTD